MMNNGDATQYATLKMLGRYHLLHLIGRGGMGDVWLAEDSRLRRQVAMKVLPSHAQQDREYALRFEREAQAAAALNHPHILPIHDYGQHLLPNGQVIAYIVMPYIAGGSLAHRIASYSKSKTHMPPQEALSYLAQAAEAIDYAHEQQVIHRDIKPENMLLRTDGWLLLADFGIARILSDYERITQTAAGFGTPEYMAPEQAQGRAEMASDNYSLAVIAYQLLVGRLPFTADTAYALTIQHITMPPPSPLQFNPALPAACEQVLLQGLAKQPAQRPPSAHTFVAELQRAFIGTPLTPTQRFSPHETIPETPVKRAGDRFIQRPPSIEHSQQVASVKQSVFSSQRRRFVLGGAATLFVVGGGLGIWGLLATENTSKQVHYPKITPTAKPKPQFSPGPDAPVLVLREHNTPASTLSWSAEGNLVSAGTDGQVLLWNVPALQTQHIARLHFETGLAMLLAWSPDGNYLAIGNAGGDAGAETSNLYVYTKNLASPAPGFDPNAPIQVSGTSVQGLGWMHSSYVVTAASPLNFSNQFEFQLALWNVKQPGQQFIPATVHGGPLTSTSLLTPVPLASSPDGSLVALALANGVLVGQLSLTGNATQWKARSALLQFSTTSTQPYAVTWSPSGRAIAALSTDPYPDGSTIAVWNWQERTASPYLITADTPLTAIAWDPAPTSNRIAAGTKKGEVRLWEADKNNLPTRILQGLNAEVVSIAWSRDGIWLAASYKDVDASILIWKVSP